MSREVLADSIHQFNVQGMFPKKMETGGFIKVQRRGTFKGTF